MLRHNWISAAAVVLAAGPLTGWFSPAPAPVPVVNECASPSAAWIWCDDFEQDRLGSYFEYRDADGSLVRSDSVGVNGSSGMRARFTPGQVSAGDLKIAFGRTPQPYFRAVDGGMRDYREIYWRHYLRHDEDWRGGGGYKLSRATSFLAADSWAQAMIAHVWSDSRDHDYLVLDPASGTSALGTVQTSRDHHFSRLRWMGMQRVPRPIFRADHVGRWYCIEARVKLNRPGQSDGVFELWIDDRRETRIDGLNWVGGFQDYGINAVFLENYWNDGAPREQERFLDNFVVSTERIGC